MKRTQLLAALSLLVHPMGAQADTGDVRVLPASTDWLVDFGDERCSLIREFSDGAATMRLQIDSYGPAPGYQVVISGDLVAGSAAAPLTTFAVSYSPDTRPRAAMRMIVGEMGDQKAVSYGPGFLPDEPWADANPIAFERAITDLTIAFADQTPVRLETGSMADPFAVTRQCIDDLVASWGLDPEEQRKLSQPPLLLELPDGYRTVKVDLKDTHPGPTARRYRPLAEQQARMRERPVPRAGYPGPVRIMIDAEGRTTACVAQVASASEESRKERCERFAGPYRPALDAEGNPVPSFVQLGLLGTTVGVVPDGD